MLSTHESRRSKVLPRIAGAVGLAVSFTLATVANAAAFPERAVTLVVPFDPGGGTDVLARLIGQQLSPVISQPVVIENKPGAGGTLGVAYTARAKPDGYTAVLVNALAHTASTLLYDNPGYDAIKSFAPIGTVGTVPYMLVVNPQFPAKDYAAFVQTLRAAPGKYNGASAGSGSAPHLALELYKRTVGVDVVHVPYKGSGPALNDLIGGRVDLEFENVAAAGHIKSGRLRALAVTGKKRLGAFPDVPTFAESGQGDFEVVGYWGLLAPAGTPPEAIATLSRALARVVDDPSMRAKLEAQGLEPESGNAEAFGAILSSEQAKWSRLIRESNIKR